MSGEDDRFFRWLAKNDTSIEIVFDVGAHRGGWTRLVSQYFPDAEYYLFEPRLKFDTALRQEAENICQGINTKIYPVAVGSTGGVAKFSVQGERGVGSSLLFDDNNEDSEIIDVDLIDLDSFVDGTGIEKIDLLKMDIQGGELSALKGAENSLANTRYVVLETWLVSSYWGKTPHIYEVFDFLKTHDIVPIDFLGCHRNPTGMLVHIDVVYVNLNFSTFPKHLHRAIHARLRTGREAG